MFLQVSTLCALWQMFLTATLAARPEQNIPTDTDLAHQLETLRMNCQFLAEQNEKLVREQNDQRQVSRSERDDAQENHRKELADKKREIEDLQDQFLQLQQWAYKFGGPESASGSSAIPADIPVFQMDTARRQAEPAMFPSAPTATSSTKEPEAFTAKSTKDEGAASRQAEPGMSTSAPMASPPAMPSSAPMASLPGVASRQALHPTKSDDSLAAILAQMMQMQNHMLENFSSTIRPKESDELKFEDWPSFPDFDTWKQGKRRYLQSKSGRPKECQEYLERIDKATKIENLEDDGTFESYSSKIKTAAFKCFQREFKRRMEIKDLELRKEKRYLNGPMLLWLMKQ